jgi:hypothetical protein
MQQQEQQREDDYSTIRISRKTLDQLGKHAKFRDNWDNAIQRVLKKAENPMPMDFNIQS